jgi:hypothetical protein
MCKYMLKKLLKELLPYNTKVANEIILKLFHSMHIDCYHGNIIKLLYSIYIRE